MHRHRPLGKAKKRNQRLPPNQTFVSIYFRRNMFYLYSAHALACMGFCDPSMNIQRTVYESILWGYYFILFESVANHYLDAYGTEDEVEYINRLSHGCLIGTLFKSTTRAQLKELYKMLCRFAHPDFYGTGRDFPIYNENLVEDRLKLILCFAYGNIQMLAEGFLNLLNSELKNLIKFIMREILIVLDYKIPKFAPDKGNLSSRIVLKEGNFDDILN